MGYQRRVHGTHTKSRRMKVFSIATLATVAMAQKGTMMLDEDVECENFGGKFDKIKGMKPVCTVNKGPIAKKWRCNLKCSNKNENVWSVRPIKCKIKNHPESKRFDSNLPTTYKWRPHQIQRHEQAVELDQDQGQRATDPVPVRLRRLGELGERQGLRDVPLPRHLGHVHLQLQQAQQHPLQVVQGQELHCALRAQGQAQGRP